VLCNKSRREYVEIGGIYEYMIEVILIWEHDLEVTKSVRAGKNKAKRLLK